MDGALRPLTLFNGDKKSTGNYATLHGSAGKACRETTLRHSIHRQASQALATELLRHPLLWTKRVKRADQQLTPDWAWCALHEAVDSFLIMGYVAWRRIPETNQVIIAPPTTLDVHFVDGVWVVCGGVDVDGVRTEDWTVIMITPPVRDHVGNVLLNSPSVNAAADTQLYDELQRNAQMRDFFNSRPSVFTTVDHQLKNHNGSTAQWFQQATAGDAAASRTTSIDTNFQSLVRSRARSIQRLQDETAVARERLSTHGGTKLAGQDERIEDSMQHMQHKEHIITDGRETSTTRALLSMTDGFQTMSMAMYNIFFHLRVPPQTLGRNINAERTAINPRLNEMVLQSFFVFSGRLRSQFATMFTECSVDGATLQFHPCLSPYDIDVLEPVIHPEKMVTLYSLAYQLPESYFSESAIAIKQQSGSGTSEKRKLPAPETSGRDGAPAKDEQKKEQELDMKRRKRDERK